MSGFQPEYESSILSIRSNAELKGNSLLENSPSAPCESSSFGRAPAFQAGGGGFEARLSLKTVCFRCGEPTLPWKEALLGDKIEKWNGLVSRRTKPGSEVK